jgi:hypothetical protein
MAPKLFRCRDRPEGRIQWATVSRQLPKKGHREVASETLLPIILEVGTLGHILLTDPHGPREKMSSEGFHRLPKDYGGNGCLLSLSPSRKKRDRDMRPLPERRLVTEKSGFATMAQLCCFQANRMLGPNPPSCLSFSLSLPAV